MSHFTVLVIGKDVDKQLAPYDENKKRTVDPKWDWYVIGGRWGGYFTLKPGKTGTLREPSTFDKLDGDKRDHAKVDQALKGDIDFDAMRRDAGDKARERYQIMADLLGGTIPSIVPWKELIDKPEYKAMDIDAKRTFYHGQEPLARLRAQSKNPAFSKAAQELAIWSEYDDFLCTEETYVERAKNRAVSTFAVVKRGQWYEKGSMGW